MDKPTPVNSRLFYAEDYGKQCLRSLELWRTRGMWADQANALTTARKAAHWAARYLDERIDGPCPRMPHID